MSRRWLVFGAVVVLLAYLAWWLGEWQFHRLEDRRAENEVIETNVAREPAPIEQVLSPGQPVAESQQWRRVIATGTYDAAETVIVRYRSDGGGQGGVGVVVPLVTDNGPTLVVDRGFLATETRTATPDEVPPPPRGEVTVVGWVRVDGTGDSTRVDDLSTRAINSQAIGEAIGQQTYVGFVDLVSEDPAASTTLELRGAPETGEGPHFFYGLQWWFFGLLAVGGFGYLAYDERQRGPRGERARRRPTRPERPRQPSIR